MHSLKSVLLWFLLFSLPALLAQQSPVSALYSKREVRIPMRDGKTLFTVIYAPRDTTRLYPILLNRTPYDVGPYGKDKYMRSLGPSDLFMASGYIFVYQDVRGRFMSQGEYVNMRPYVPGKKGAQIDEASDTYDTIEWLIHHVPGNNGRVGMWGISYPGFYAAMGLIDAHPALKAVSPQAPIADWFIGDDMHHHGALTLNLAFRFLSVFGVIRDSLTTRWPPAFPFGTPDGYDFFLRLGPLKNANKRYFHHTIPFWDSLMVHDTYDEFWQKRNILPHLTNIKPAVLVVGGWYDMEDLYGTLHIARAIDAPEKYFIMGPWYHGAWARSSGFSLGDFAFGDSTSFFYQRQVEFPFFEYYLKGKKVALPPPVLAFDTGLNRWDTLTSWPPRANPTHWYLRAGEGLSLQKPDATESEFSAYWSDPARPVPYTEKITTRWDREYMIADQRFAARRPDVLVFQTAPLKDTLTIAGPITARLYLSTTGSDADWVVKVIDVYPDHLKSRGLSSHKRPLGGYQRLLRAEIFRGKFRRDYSQPIPFQAGVIDSITIPLQDVYHTLLPGHRLMVQIQSTLFPLFDRNPQQFMHIPAAEEWDFKAAWQRIYHDEKCSSQIIIPLKTK